MSDTKGKRTGIGRRGIVGIEIAIIGAIVMVGIVLSLAVLVGFLKIHLVKVVEIQYGYNNVGATMLALLADDDIYNDISLYVAGMEDNAAIGFDRAEVENVLDARLEKLAIDECYVLSYSGGEIVRSGKCDGQYTVTAAIVLPDTPRTEEIRLLMSSS
jgi:hypothetical protein